MRKVVILTLVTLFTCVEYSQAQTTEKPVAEVCFGGAEIKGVKRNE